LGMARTFSPIFYARADGSGRYRLTPRLIGRVGSRGEGAKIFESDRPAGWVHAPFAETIYALTRRTSVGAQYRMQLFVFGADQAMAHGAFAIYRYRLTEFTTFGLRGGPVRLEQGARSGWLAHYNAELAYAARGSEFGLVAGHDLVGASGFTSTLWADYLSAMASVPLNRSLRAFGAAGLFRNGVAPGNNLFFSQDNTGSAEGYAVGGGLELKLSRAWNLQGTFDRMSQFGGVERADEVGLARNIVAVRLAFTAW
jgi:hypothetical protein